MLAERYKHSDQGGILLLYAMLLEKQGRGEEAIVTKMKASPLLESESTKAALSIHLDLTMLTKLLESGE